MVKNNPYTTTPGKVPQFSFIERPRQIDDIIDEFCEEYPSNQVYKIKGLRGTGKTVVLREIGKELKEKNNWLVFDLNVEGDLMNEFYDKLVIANRTLKVASNTKFKLSTVINVEYDRPENKTVAGEIIPYLEAVKKKKDRILITIDEVFDKDELRFFISQCQIWVGEDYPIFLLTAGLEHNYDEIYAHKSMTFFKRAPLKELESLDLNRVVDNYAEKFRLNETEAEQMAKITKGYAYAFQLLGYVCWKYDKSYKDVLKEFDKEIDNNAYQLIWKELSAGDKKTLIAIAKTASDKIIDIRQTVDVSAQSFNQSKERLIERKLIENDERGVIHFTLPRFSEFVLRAERLY